MLASAVFTWPLVTHMSNTLPDWGDAGDSAKNLGSIALQLRTDPLRLYESRFAYPLHNSLTLGEIMTGQGLLATPIIWLTGNIPLAQNLLNFASYVLSGFGVWLLVRHLTGSSAAGLVAGMIFAFSPWHFSQYWHLALGAQHWMVFALFFLILFMEATGPGSPRLTTRRSLLYLALFAFFVVLQAITAGYYAYYEAILVGIYLAYYLLFGSGLAASLWSHWRDNEPAYFDWGRLIRQFAMVGVASVIALVQIVIVALPYAQTKALYDFKRPLEEVNYFSAGPLSLLQTSTLSWLFQPVQQGIFHVDTGPEGPMYPGVVAVLLALVGLAAWRGFHRGSKRTTAGPWLFAVVNLVGLVLSFGPRLNWTLYTRDLSGLKLPYSWLYHHVPGWDSMRVPHRFALIFMLGLAVCAGYGVAWLLRRVAQGRSTAFAPTAVVAVLVLLIGADFFAPGLSATYTPTGDQTPALYQWLASPESRSDVPADALLLELPIYQFSNAVTTDPIYLMYGLAHGRPMLNASINIIPPGFDRFMYDMGHFPSPATLDIIEALGTKYVIAHTGALSDAARAELTRQSGPNGRLVPVKRFPDFTGNTRFEDVVYKVVPDPTRVASLLAAIPPGSTVMLPEDPTHQSLYTNALVRLLGPDRHYFSQYSTMYDSLFGSIQSAVPHKFYDYAILYKDAVKQANGSAGYAPSEAIPGAENDVVQVFRKEGQQ